MVSARLPHVAKLLNKIKSWFSRSETSELRYDADHKDFTETHHYTDSPKPHMRDRIDPND
jgi:hypothetical protein